MKIIKAFTTVTSVIALTLLGALSFNAATSASCALPNQTLLGIPPWYSYLEGEEVQQLDSSGSPKAETACQPVVQSKTDILLILAAILTILIRVAGIAAFIYLLYGGFTYLTSDGNSENVKNAGTILLNAVIGLTIAISATVFMNFFAGRLSS